jgi:hypothetical protein
MRLRNSGPLPCRRKSPTTGDAEADEVVDVTLSNVLRRNVNDTCPTPALRSQLETATDPHRQQRVLRIETCVPCGPAYVRCELFASSICWPNLPFGRRRTVERQP